MNKYGVEPFAGVGFSNWLYRIETVLSEYESLEVVKTERVETDTTWAKKNAKATSIIVQCISDSNQEYIEDCESAEEILEKFTNIFQRTGIASQLLIRGRLLTSRYNERNSLEKHYIELDKLVG
ncbi:hypothetical protein JTB14_002590 [Gonioctena quinquepunctata]|nr:hypothetical protein JTB14_002590 [Gonioctena quinquepunctata]